jgi:hypothetical protein
MPGAASIGPRRVVIPAASGNSPVCQTSEDAMAQTTQIALEYLMTIHAELDPPQLVAGTRVVNVTGGWADGRSNFTAVIW